jgi:hypothetical protein
LKITVFTSNQPRHLGLITSLSNIADEVFAIQECTTVFPGEVEDFYRRSEVMQRYFSRVIDAERQVFGGLGFVPGNVRQLALKMGDVSKLPLEALKPALEADIYIVFGASYIRGHLVEKLIEDRAINIHMGASPYYRGSSCNFWAMYDGRPEYVGATIHLLSAGLDSGDMLFHAFPDSVDPDPFVYGMQSVRSAHMGLSHRIADGSLLKIPPVKQNKDLELRYTRNKDFTDEVAADYLENLPGLDATLKLIEKRDNELFLNPYFG